MGYAELSWLYVIIGRKYLAKKYLEKALKSKSYTDPGAFAVAYLALGNKERAIKYVEKAIKEKSTYCFFIKRAPSFDLLRNDPRFQTLMDKLNLP